MFGFLKSGKQYKKDNLVLMGRIASLEERLKSAHEAIAEKDLKIEKLKKSFEYEVGNTARLEETCEGLRKEMDKAAKKLDKPVTYASARKTMTKAKLKQLRESIEAVPANVALFGGSVSVYDKKTKRLSVVKFTSKAEALEVLSRAEKGHVDIVI